MRFTTTLLITLAFGLVAHALPTADAEAIPIYGLEERDAENSTSIDALACHVNFFGGDHCGGNVGDPQSIPTGSQGVCSGVGPSSGHKRHSYKIAPACHQVRMYFYKENGCGGNTPHHVTVGSGCHNIDTGGPVNSVKAIRA